MDIDGWDDKENSPFDFNQPDDDNSGWGKFSKRLLLINRVYKIDCK